MNKISLFSGCAAAAVLMTAGCRPELAQGNYGSEEQQWQDVISASYSGHRPPRIAPPAIVDRASQEALEKQRMQQENAKNTDAVSEVPAPGDDKNDPPAVKETSAAEVVDSAAEKTQAKDPEAADRKESVARDAFVIPSSTLVPFAGSLPSFSSAAFVFSNVSQSTREPGRKSVSPFSSILIRFSI